MALKVRYRSNFADPDARLTGFAGQIRGDLSDAEVRRLVDAGAVELWLEGPAALIPDAAAAPGA